MRNLMLVLLAVGFFLFGLVAMLESRPEPKPKHLMKELEPYIPFKLEKRFGGLSIIDTRSGEKYKISNEEVFHELDRLERGWGKTHLRLEGENLIVTDDRNKTVATIRLENEKERQFVHSFFGI